MRNILEAALHWLSLVLSRLRAILLSARGANIAHKVSIGPRCMFGLPECISLGFRVVLEQDVFIKVVADKAQLKIGDNSFLGKGVEIDCQNSISIGEHVLLAPGCFLTDHNHGIAAEKRIDQQACTVAPVVIEDDVWVGVNAVILSGVTLREGAVIGAGAVVTHDVDPFDIVAGIPARIIGKRV